jgi:hypothetical protein
MSSKVVFTGVYRNNAAITNMSLEDRIDLIKSSGIDDIYWFTWKGNYTEEIEDHGVQIIEIDEPYPHVRGVEGRQRQIYNFKECLKHFDDDDVILKLRWDLDFSNDLINNIKNPSFFDKIDNGIIENKIWVGFYSIIELFSPADLTFAGFKKDLDKVIKFQHTIDGVSANNYISHDGMTLMPAFIENNSRVKDAIKIRKPDPWVLMFSDKHLRNPDLIYCWAYNFFIFNKYFKTGPLGTCFFKRGDVDRWPASIVDYDNFEHNFDTMIGKKPMLGMYPRYRVYDDIFVKRLVEGVYDDDFGTALYREIQINLNKWNNE